MAVEDPEEGAFRPVFALLRGRLHNVKDDGDSVLIIIPYNALVSVSCVTRDHPVLADRAFRLLKVWQHHRVRVRVRCVPKEQRVDISDCRWLRCGGLGGRARADF